MYECRCKELQRSQELSFETPVLVSLVYTTWQCPLQRYCSLLKQAENILWGWQSCRSVQTSSFKPGGFCVKFQHLVLFAKTLLLPQAVKSVQADLNEIRSLTRPVDLWVQWRLCLCLLLWPIIWLARYTRSSWFRTFSVVGSLTLACVLQPWFLFSSSEAGLNTFQTFPRFMVFQEIELIGNWNEP